MGIADGFLGFILYIAGFSLLLLLLGVLERLWPADNRRGDCEADKKAVTQLVKYRKAS